MEKIWFLFLNENISGPFSTEEIKEKTCLHTQDPNVFVWMKGQRNWMPLSKWLKEYPEIIKNKAADTNDAPIWSARLENRTLGPMTKKDLIKFLNSIDSFAWEAVRIRTSGQSQWTKIYEHESLIDELGGSRRSHLRAPLNGFVEINKNGKDQVGKILSISLGGIGAEGLSDLCNGDTVKLVIKSHDLGPPIYALAQIRYITDNEAGLQFQNLHMEFQARILDYIKKFEPDPNIKNKAA